MSTFAVLASEDFESKQAQSRAITATVVRAQEMFDPFLSKAASAGDKADRILLIEDDLKKIAYAVSREYGYPDYNHLFTATKARLAETKTAKTCPECEKGTMRQDDHVWICPKCDYETSEPDDDEEEEEDDDDSWKKPWEKDSTKTANKYIKERDGKWVIIQKGTGKVLSTHDSEEQAQSSFNAMEANKHGKTAAEAPETGDSYQSERVKLPSNKDTGLGGPSPKIDKGSAGDVAHTSQKPIDVGSKRHQHELQSATDRADYNNSDFDPSSPVRKRIDADKSLQSEHNVAPHTDTWHGTDGQAKPVTSGNPVVSKYQLVSVD